jgi:PleD family two-component response regulator
MSANALIAGDDDLIRAMLRSALEAQDYQVFETRNCQDCIQKYEQINPSIIFLDCAMPVMDGYTCCKLLRQKSSAKYTPIIMILSRNDSASIQQAFESGATDYIPRRDIVSS